MENDEKASVLCSFIGKFSFAFGENAEQIT